MKCERECRRTASRLVTYIGHGVVNGGFAQMKISERVCTVHTGALKRLQYHTNGEILSIDQIDDAGHVVINLYSEPE